MQKKRKVLCFMFLFSFALISANASAISFQVVQHDASKDSVSSSSYLVEDTLMNYFFEAGYIVSNTPAVVSADADSDLLVYSKSLGEAAEGYCDTFVMVFVEYDTKNSTNPDGNVLSNISSINWMIYKVSTGALLSQETCKNTISKNENSDKGIVSFAETVAKKIGQSLKKTN